MRGAIHYGPKDLRFEEREMPTIIKPTDAIIRISASCVRSDLRRNSEDCAADPTWLQQGKIQPVPSRGASEGGTNHCSQGNERARLEPVDGAINERTGDAYRAKYKGSPYLTPMIGARARAAPIKIMPR
jgi:hypothetical protein